MYRGIESRQQVQRAMWEYKKQCKLLREDHWNNPTPSAHFKTIGAQLHYADLTKLDLSDFQFAGANLSYADFTGSNLHNVNFDYCNLEGANFKDANVGYATFRFANLEWTDFTEVDNGTENVTLSGSQLWGAHIHNIRIGECRFSDADHAMISELLRQGAENNRQRMVVGIVQQSTSCWLRIVAELIRMGFDNEIPWAYETLHQYQCLHYQLDSVGAKVYRMSKSKIEREEGVEGEFGVYSSVPLVQRPVQIEFSDEAVKRFRDELGIYAPHEEPIDPLNDVYVTPEDEAAEELAKHDPDKDHGDSDDDDDYPDDIF